MNPSWQQKNLIEYCKAKGIIITAYSPLGGKGASWGTNEVMESELLKHIAEAHGKTIAQVILILTLFNSSNIILYVKLRENSNLVLIAYSKLLKFL